MYKYIFYLIFCFFSCNSDRPTSQNSISLSNNSNLPNLTIEIRDSFTVDFPGSIFMVDYDPETTTFLFFDFISYSILTYDYTKRELKEFNRKGGGPEEYGIIKGLGFFADGNVIVRSVRDLMIYDRQGNYVRTIPNSSGVVATVPRNFNIEYYVNNQQDTVLILAGTYETTLSAASPNFYHEVYNYALTNITKNEINSIIPFPEASIYKQDVKDYAERQPEIKIAESENKIFTIFPYEPTLFVYDLISGKPSYEIKTDPVFFSKEILGYPMMIEKDMLEAYHHEQLNSHYASVQYSEDEGIILLHYATGIAKENLVNSRSENYKVFEGRRNYIQLFKEREKISEDIALPDNCKVVTYFNSTKFMVLRKHDKNSDDGITYYITSLEIK